MSIAGKCTSLLAKQQHISLELSIQRTGQNGMATIPHADLLSLEYSMHEKQNHNMRLYFIPSTSLGWSFLVTLSSNQHRHITAYHFNMFRIVSTRVHLR